MGLKWMSIFCPKAKYVLKTHDDIFVNIPLLIKALEKETKDFSSHISGIYLRLCSYVELGFGLGGGHNALKVSEYRTPQNPRNFRSSSQNLLPGQLKFIVKLMPWQIYRIMEKNDIVKSGIFEKKFSKDAYYNSLMLGI